MKFTKGNNPNKKRRRYKTRTERDIDIAKGMITDSRLGYNVPISAYTGETHRKEKE